MEVTIDISSDYKIPYALIHTAEVTEEVMDAVEFLSTNSKNITAQSGNKLAVLKPNDIYMIRIECGETVIYGKEQNYFSRKRLYELAEILGSRFMQISKCTLVNLSYLDSVEAGFNGTLLLKLKNGSEDYVSRKFLPKFKKYLGL